MMLIPFMEAELDSKDYLHCILVQEYLDTLKDHNVVFNDNLRNRFINEAYKLFKTTNYG